VAVINALDYDLLFMRTFPWFAPQLRHPRPMEFELAGSLRQHTKEGEVKVNWDKRNPDMNVHLSGEYTDKSDNLGMDKNVKVSLPGVFRLHFNKISAVTALPQILSLIKLLHYIYGDLEIILPHSCICHRLYKKRKKKKYAHFAKMRITPCSIQTV
jgi:hypothetical protein